LVGTSPRRGDAAGRFEEGLSAVAEAVTIVEKTGERLYEAVLLLRKADLLLGQDLENDGKADQLLRSAIDISRRQGAKLFELWATMSLARLLERLGRRDEARAMLSEIYGWFTEGFDTGDLQAARALLENLS